MNDEIEIAKRAEGKLGTLGNLLGSQILTAKIQTSIQRRMHRVDVRVPLLPTRKEGDIGFGMIQQDPNQF